MSKPLPVVLVPGLNCSARLYAEQIPALRRLGPVVVADHTRGDSMAELAGQILAVAPPQFALVGLSLGGYIAFEMLRQASQRIVKLALLDTTAAPERPEQTGQRLPQIELAKSGRFAEIPAIQFPLLVHRDRHADTGLQRIVHRMAEETGAAAFLRQQTAIMARPDSRPHLSAIACPTLVLVGDGDALTPPAMAQEIASGIRGARLGIVPDCGHLSTLERPETVTAALVEWMQDARA